MDTIDNIMKLAYEYGESKAQLEPSYTTQAVNYHVKAREALLTAVTELASTATEYQQAAPMVAPDVLSALKMAVLQNSHDMLMTGEEIRKCESAIQAAMGGAA